MDVSGEFYEILYIRIFTAIIRGRHNLEAAKTLILTIISMSALT